jgi:hypothetical protein
VKSISESSYLALTTSITSILLSASLATAALAATTSKSIETTPAILATCDCPELPEQYLDAGTPIQPYTPFTAGAPVVPEGRL